MTSRLDEIFSSDRLRQNWQMQIKPAHEPTRIALNLEIQAKYHELQRLIDEEFPDTSRLAIIFAELAEKINQTFPLEVTSGLVDAKQKEVIIEMLEHLEELLWAMGLPQGDEG